MNFHRLERLRGDSLAAKLLARIVPAALLLVLSLQGASYFMLRHETLLRLDRELHLTSTQYSRLIEGLFRRFSGDLETLADTSLIRDYYSNVDYGLNEEAQAYRRELQRYFQNFYARNGLYSAIRYLDAAGRTVCEVGSAAKDAPVVYRRPIRDSSGAPKGVLELRCDTRSIQSLLDGIHIGNNGGGYLTSRGADIGKPSLSALSLAVRRPVSGTPWTLVLAADKNEFLQPLERIQRVALLIAAFGIVLMLAILVGGIRAGLSPLAELLAAIRKMGSGDLDQTMPVRGADEISAVSGAFNEMAVRLRRNKKTLEDTIDQLLALQTLNQAIFSRADRDTILRTCLEAAVNGLHFDRGTLYWLDPKSRELVGHCAHNMEGVTDEMMHARRFSLERDDILAYVMRANEAVFVADPRSDPRCNPAYVQETGTRSFCAAPIRGKEAVLGVIATDNYYTNRPIRPEDVESLTLFTSSAGIALENTELTGKVHQAQEALIHAEKMSAIGQLIAGIAHEISNPLAAVSGYAQLVMMSDPPEELRDDLDLVQKSAQRCKKIMDNLLLFARRDKPSRKPVCVCEALQNVRELLGYRLEKRERVHLTVDFDPAARPVLGDLHQLEQVFLNLINNACDAMQLVPGPRKLAVRSKQMENQLRIEVQDSGPGVAPVIADRIFEPFFSTKPAGRGTGLGLPIVRRIIEEHGGTIRCDSRIGQGATFILELPTTSAQVERESSTEPRWQAQPRKRILIVDDEPALGAMMGELLRRDQDYVDIALDGVRALALMKERVYHLIVTDMALGEIHGDRIVEAWHLEHRPRGTRLMIITGDTFNQTAAELAVKYGTGYLAKPFDLADFQQLARRLLSESAVNRPMRPKSP